MLGGEVLSAEAATAGAASPGLRLSIGLRRRRGDADVVTTRRPTVTCTCTGPEHDDGGPREPFGRLSVSQDLKVEEAPQAFAQQQAALSKVTVTTVAIGERLQAGV